MAIKWGYAALPEGLNRRFHLELQKGVVEHLFASGGTARKEVNISDLDAYETWHSTTTSFCRRLFLDDSALRPPGDRALYLQQWIDLARLAIASEQYFSKSSVYPEDLSDLVPEYLSALPEDRFLPATPIRYEKARNGRYRFIAVGPNRVFEGGKEFSDRLPDRAHGDMVWRYPDD